jgi:hypothetical protein
MDLKEIIWEDVDLFNLAQERENWWVFINTVMRVRVP